MIHVAGRAHIAHDERAARLFLRDNVETTRACLDAAIGAGAKSFVLISSVAAVTGNDGGFITDATPPRPTNAYGQSKLQAEQLVRQGAPPARVQVSILRPPMVYGPGMLGNPLRLLQILAKGVPLPFRTVRNQRSILFVGNLVHAVERLLTPRAHSGEPFLVSDDEPVSTPELMRRIGIALARPARLLPVAPVILRALGRVGDVAGRFVPFPITSASMSGLTGTLVLDDSRLRAETGFMAPYSLDEGLRVTADWFLSRPGSSVAAL
jgi:nucleoside-diphosphate-sugar epimerase